MSEQSIKSQLGAQMGSSWRDKLQRRWHIYAAIGIAALLTLAYFDAGEEPLRPITQPIALGGEGQ